MSLLARLKFDGWMRDVKDVRVDKDVKEGVGLITNWWAFTEEGQRQPVPGYMSEVEVLGS